MTRLEGKTVLVTGAAGGIGAPLCQLLAARRCRLGLIGRTSTTLEALAERIRQGGAEASAQPADLRDMAAVVRAVANIEREIGRIDVLIHNAALAFYTRAWSPSVDELEEMVQVNYLGGMRAIEAVLPSMMERGRGHLVAISSLSALRGMAWTAGYSASKAALAAAIESLRPALARREIQTTTCHLGFVRTAMASQLPFRFRLWMLSPDQAARRIVRAVERRRREAYFPWYDAVPARFLARLPCWAFDGVMNTAGRWMLREEY